MSSVRSEALAVNGGLPAAELRFLLLTCVFIAAWAMMQMFLVKLVPLDLSFLGIGLVSFAFAEFLFAITFPITDVVTEVWGPRRARWLVIGGLGAYAFVSTLLAIATVMPGAAYWSDQEAAYDLLFSAAPRNLVASIIAIFISQMLDISVYSWIRRRTGDRWLWLRNNASTFVAQGVDTVVFYFIAFYGLMPTPALLSLLVGNYCLKLVLAVIDTPLVYLLVAWARDGRVGRVR